MNRHASKQLLGKPYRTSRFLRSVDHPSGHTAVYHSFFGHALLLTRMAADFLESFSRPRIPSAWDLRSAGLLRDCLEREFLVPDGEEERKTVLAHFCQGPRKAISALGLVVAEECNFRCHQCVHFQAYKLDGRPRRPALMRLDTARKAMDWVAHNVMESRGSFLLINFGGGEPLMNWGLVREIMADARKRLAPRLEVRLSINTNASLVTADIARDLKEFDVRVVTSLDGPRDGNDAVRRTREGAPTFDLIWKAFGRLEAAGIGVKALHVGLHSKNLVHLDEAFVHSLSERGVLSISVEPDLTDTLRQPVSALVEKILELRAAARKRGMTVTGYWERPFGRIILQEKNRFSHFCSAMAGESIDVLPDGTLYGCSYTDRRLGHLETFAGEEGNGALDESPAYREMTTSSRAGEINGCRGCDLEGLCAGGCRATAAHAAHRAGWDLIQYRCGFYREITRRLIMEAIERRISDASAGLRNPFPSAEAGASRP